MKKLMWVLALTLAACGGGAASDTTTTTDGTEITADDAGGVESTVASATDTAASDRTTTTTTRPETTTTTAPTDTTVAASSTGGVDSCLVGTWELDDESFVALMQTAAGEMNPTGGEVEVYPSGGVYQMTAGDDGTWTAERIDWGWVISLGETDEIVTLANGTDTGTWSADGATLTTTLDSTDVTVQVTGVVGGVEIAFDDSMLPDTFGSEAISSGSVTYECGDDTLNVTSEDGYGTVWVRV